jgi:hypothetical protein
MDLCPDRGKRKTIPSRRKYPAFLRYFAGFPGIEPAQDNIVHRKNVVLFVRVIRLSPHRNKRFAADS